MADQRETLTHRVQNRLEELGLTARAVSLDVSGKPDTLRDMFRRRSIPDGATLARIAERLATTTDYLLGTSETPEQVRSEVGISDRRIEWNGFDRNYPGIPLVGTADCAELEVSTETGQMVSIDRASFDPEYHVTYIARPIALRGDRDAYAIYYHGESMVPRFYPGEIGIAQPSRPVGAGDYVVVQLRGSGTDEVISVIVKKLKRQSAKEVWLEQYNPPMVFAIPRAQVARMHRIMPPDAALFV